MVEWSRDTDWRQGHLLPPEILAEEMRPRLPFEPQLQGDEWGVVITHDCDLAQLPDNEPFVELILARAIGRPDGNCTHARNPRKLHLDISAYTAGDASVVLELSHERRGFVRKEELSKAVSALEHPFLDSSGRNVLRSWLAARYRRQALPNELDQRLRPIVQVLKDKGKRHAETIIGYWISSEPASESLPEEEPYEVDLRIVYSVDREGAEQGAREVLEAVKEQYRKMREAGQGPFDCGLDLKCDVVSEMEFTLHDIRHFVEYRLDDVSHRYSPEGPFSDE